MDARQGMGARPGAGPRPVSPASGPHVYGSARPAPSDAFPTRPDAQQGRRPTEGPFDLRPAPELGSPAPARPAAQPTRVTPSHPAAPPAPLYPSVPGQARPVSGPAQPGPGDHPRPMPADQARPGPADQPRPLAQPRPEHPWAAPASMPTAPPRTGPADYARPSSSPAQPSLDHPWSVPPAQAGPPEQPRPVSAPSQPGPGYSRPVSTPTHAGPPDQPRPVSAPTQPGPDYPRPVSAPSQTGPDYPRPVSAAAHAGASEQPGSWADAFAPRHSTPEEVFDRSVRPVTALPASERVVLPDGPVAGSGIEPVTSPPAGPPTGEESHGLGWLLSQSGLGATSPVPIETVAEEPAPEPELEPESESESESESTSEPESEPASGPVVEDSAPVSGAPQKQNWFVPVTGSQPIITPAGAEAADDEPAEDEPVAAELVDEPIAAAPLDEPVVAEIVDEPVVAEIIDEPVVAEIVNETVVAEFVDEPVVAVLVDEPARAERIEEPRRAAPIEEPVDAVLVEDEPIVAEIVDEPAAAGEPVEEGPVAAEWAWNVGSFAETSWRKPAAEELVADEPFSASPVSAAPVSSAPANAHHPVSAAPVSAAPVSAAPVETGAAGTDLVAEDAVEAELVDIEPVDAKWVEAELPPSVEDHLGSATAKALEPAVTDEAADEPEQVDETGPETEPEAHDEPHDEPEARADSEQNDEPKNEPKDEAQDERKGAAKDEHEPAAQTEDNAAPVTVGLMADDGRPEPGHEDADAEREAPSGRDAEPPGTVPLVPDEARKLIRQRAETAGAAGNRRADPEQVLADYPWAFDTTTLRERIDDPDQMWVVIDRLTDKLEYAERDTVRARLLSLRAVAERLVEDLDAALADARSALTHAESVGELRQTAVVQARLAHVLQWRGEYAEADKLYAEAASPELPSRLRAEIHELAGRSAFDQGRYLEAMNHFETSLDLRKGADPELVERIEAALDTITRRTKGGDWGPYPRTADEILGRTEPPRPIRDERSGLWGFVGAVPPRYAQAQPFADGLAWVRRPETPAWELIDLAGRTVIDASAGYLAAERFAEGLAWVSRDEAGGWYAIDQHNRLIIPGGFDDAKAFHHGLALVKRGGWGVIDRHGRLVVQPRYRGFVTPLVSGGPIEGFTDEGLAVVDAGETFGVVDRTGKLIVPAEHAAVVIHPTAFLIADQYGLWGALSRSGESLVERKYKEQADVLDQIDRLRSDGRPVL